MSGDEGAFTLDGRPAPKWTGSLSPKQVIVLAHLQKNGQLTLDEAVELIGGDIYANKKFHVGNVLSRMVKRGMIHRVKPGTFALIAELGKGQG